MCPSHILISLISSLPAFQDIGCGQVWNVHTHMNNYAYYLFDQLNYWPHPLKGHLSRYLSFHHGLSVTAVEAESSHLTAATRLDRYNNNSFRRTPLNIKTPLFNEVSHCFVEKWVVIWRGKEKKIQKKEYKVIETSGILNIRWADKIHWCV